MQYFKNVTSVEEVKSLYKKLALANHPDMGGDSATMQEINNEFEEAFKFAKIHDIKKNTTTKESASDFTRDFYTANGWQGDRYDPKLNTKDITKIIRDYVKLVYPTFKFSIRMDSYNAIRISMINAPVNMFKNGIEKQHPVNHYYVNEDIAITDYAKSIFTDIYTVLSSYNYDDSDAMTDYFNTNFYTTLSIGTYEKPFTVVEKKARLSGTADMKVKEIA